MPASSVSSLHAIGDVVSGRNVRARAFYPAFRALLVAPSAATTAIATGGFSKVPYNSRTYDPAKAWNTTNNNIVISMPAVYSFTGTVSFATNANVALITVGLFINNAENYRGAQWQFPAATASTYAFPFCFNVPIVTSGSVVDVRLFQNSTANININGGASVPLLTWLTVNCIGGV